VLALLATLALSLSWGGQGASGGIDLNRAEAGLLDQLPGIGPAKAQALVAWRAINGPCRRVDDLLDVPGIGAATVAALRGRAFCGQVGPSEAEASAARDAAEAKAVRAPPAALPERVDVNSASVEALMALPGVFRKRAEAIVSARERGGPFDSCAELARVPGIGPATIATFDGICEARDTASNPADGGRR
jgi:competence protein ComEA